MDVGMGCMVSKNCFPKGEPTGLVDINGIEIMTRDKVKLRGCGNGYAFVGYNIERTKLMLVFGSKHGSVGWNLCKETIQKRHIEVTDR